MRNNHARVQNDFPIFPLFPKPQKRFLRHIHRGVGVHPTSIRQRPDFPAVPLIQRLEVFASHGCFRRGRFYLSILHSPHPQTGGRPPRRRPYSRTRRVANSNIIVDAGINTP